MPCEQIIEKHFKPFVLKEKTLPRHQCKVGVPVQHRAHARGTRAALAADEDRCVPPSAQTAATLDLSRRLSLYGVHVRSTFLTQSTSSRAGTAPTARPPVQREPYAAAASRVLRKCVTQLHGAES